LLTVYKKDDAERYTVALRDSGENVLDKVTAETLEQEFPQQHQQMETGIAGLWAGNDTMSGGWQMSGEWEYEAPADASSLPTVG